MYLETKRLIIRNFSQKDLDALVPILGNDKVMRFSLKGPLKTREDVQAYLKWILDHDEKYGYSLFAILEKHSQQLIGFAGFMCQTIDEEQRTELGYRLHPDYWGQGIALEATSALADYAFNQMHVKELVSIIDPKNEPSVKLAKRLGMHLSKNTSYKGFSVGIYLLKHEVYFSHNE